MWGTRDALAYDIFRPKNDSAWFGVEKRAVNVDNFVVATEQRIVSITYELELVPVVLLQRALQGGQ